MNENKMVTITEKEYLELQFAAQFLDCLRAAGVDCWDGYDYAQEIFDCEHE